MQFDPHTPLALFKANLELNFSLCDLLRRNALRWSEAQNRMLDGCAKDIESAVTRTLDAPDWQQFGVNAGDLGWKALQHRNCAALHLAEMAVANHSALIADIQHVFSRWQQDSTHALKQAGSAMPVSAALESLLASASNMGRIDSK